MSPQINGSWPQNGLPSRRPTTIKLQRCQQFPVLASFCCRAAWSAAPFIVAPPGHGSPVVVNADLIVMSNGQLSSMARSSVALTGMFMSRNFTMVRTTAPASRHTLARVLSVGIALQPTRSGTCCRVASRTVEPCAALAPSFCDVQWETQPLQQQSQPCCHPPGS